jgi:hypothetical protein
MYCVPLLGVLVHQVQYRWSQSCQPHGPHIDCEVKVKKNLPKIVPDPEKINPGSGSRVKEQRIPDADP